MKYFLNKYFLLFNVFCKYFQRFLKFYFEVFDEIVMYSVEIGLVE